MTLASHLLVVTADVDPAIERDWNDWYDKVHLPDIAGCPGFLSGARFESVDEKGDRHYLTVYELADPSALQSKEFATLRGWGPFAGKVAYTSRCFRRLEGAEGRRG